MYERSWRKLDSQELHNFHCPTNSIRVTRSRKTGWTKQVAQMEEKINAYNLVLIFEE
jgi:hypothetical protein